MECNDTLILIHKEIFQRLLALNASINQTWKLEALGETRHTLPVTEPYIISN